MLLYIPVYNKWCFCEDDWLILTAYKPVWSFLSPGVRELRTLDGCTYIFMPTAARSRLCSRVSAWASMSIHTRRNMCFNWRGDISTLNSSSLKLVDTFTYLGSSVSSTETDINARLAKAWTAFHSLSVIWKSDLTDKMKRSFFQAAVVSILLYGCTTWTLTKPMKKKFDSNYTRMLRAILKKSWRQLPTKQLLYDHSPPIAKTIRVRRTRHTGHSWRSRDEVIRAVLLWTPSHGRTKAERPARTYIQQLCADTRWMKRGVAVEGQGYPCWWCDMMIMMMMMMMMIYIFCVVVS